MKKMSLKEVKSLSRNEMKKIMAGSMFGECRLDPNYCKTHFGPKSCCRPNNGYICVPC